jgi:hypothetical protein
VDAKEVLEVSTLLCAALAAPWLILCALVAAWRAAAALARAAAAVAKKLLLCKSASARLQRRQCDHLAPSVSRTATNMKRGGSGF